MRGLTIEKIKYCVSNILFLLKTRMKKGVGETGSLVIWSEVNAINKSPVTQKRKKSFLSRSPLQEAPYNDGFRNTRYIY